MPEDFGNVIKRCENCGCFLKLNNTRDINRKRFCSRACMYKVIQPTQFVLPPSIETREKMRQSKVELLKRGRIPTGWRKYLSHKRIAGRGYVFIGQKREHQAVMEKALGRLLVRGEVVHHIDGNKTNNDINNLVVMTKGEHMKYHTKQRMLNYVSTGV